MTNFSTSIHNSLAIVLTALTCFGVYYIGLSGTFILDDEPNLGFLFGSKLDFNRLIHTQLSSPSGPLGRPVAMASFFANAYLSQNLFYWKLTNLLIHIATSGLIYAFVQRLVTWPNKTHKPGYLAIAVASMWLLHPLQVSTVLYTVQRMTQLSTLFTLGGLYCYLQARQEAFRTYAFAAFQTLTWLVCFPLAVLSKETALLFPLFVVLLELFVRQYDRIGNRSLSYIFIGLASACLLAFWLKSSYFLGGYNIREFTPEQRLLTEARVMVIYLAMLLIPTQKRLGFVHDDIELSNSFFEPWTTTPAIGLLALLLCSAFYLRKTLPLYSFGILFFFAGHLLESTIFPLELMYEHRNYLPSVGFLLALSVATERLMSSRRVLIYLFAGYVILLSFTTWLRADIWSSNFRLLHYFETNQAGSERVAIGLSNMAIELKEYQLAREKIKSVDTLGSKIQYLYIDCFEHKQLNDAQLAIDAKAYRITDMYASMVLMDLAQLGMYGECNFSPAAYLNLLNEILHHTAIRHVSRQKLMMYKAHYQWRLKQKEQAFNTLKETFNLDPQNPTPLLLACEWALDENMKATADELCPKALTVAADNAPNFDDLATAVKKRYPAK